MIEADVTESDGVACYKGACDVILNQCLGLKPGEKVLVVTDDERLAMGRAVYEAARGYGADATLACMPVAGVSGEEPPEPVAAAMRAADVVVCPTTRSITHTKARMAAVEAGARIATMPSITPRMFREGPITADYAEVERTTRRYADLLTGASVCRIVTADPRTGARHELVVHLEGRTGVASTGVYREPGMGGNLPSGEAFIAPLEARADGEYLVTGSIVGVGLLDGPILLTLEGGRLVGIEGPQADAVSAAIPDNPASRTIGELGIGTNPAARVTGVILEDEKIYGSTHIAFGTNSDFGGTVQAVSHIDCVTLSPEVYLDGVLVAKEGGLLA